MSIHDILIMTRLFSPSLGRWGSGYIKTQCRVGPSERGNSNTLSGQGLASPSRAHVGIGRGQEWRKTVRPLQHCALETGRWPDSGLPCRPARLPASGLLQAVPWENGRIGDNSLHLTQPDRAGCLFYFCVNFKVTKNLWYLEAMFYPYASSLSPQDFPSKIQPPIHSALGCHRLNSGHAPWSEKCKLISPRATELTWLTPLLSRE